MFMPRYFFNVVHKERSADLEGAELPDAPAAWREATQLTGELIGDIWFSFGHELSVEVTDADRHRLYLIGVSTELSEEITN